MTIDAGNSSKVIRPIIRTKNEPQGIVSAGTGVEKRGYSKRLFFCLQDRLESPKKGAQLRAESSFLPRKYKGRNCRIGAKNVENWCKCLALMAKIYYNNTLYNVVGPRFMQGVAGLRKVAEVVRTSFVYLKLPHIANSKGTIVAT